MSYRIVCDGVVIGTTELEGRDPGMAIALGRFFPTAGYQEIQSVFRLKAEAGWDLEKLQAYWSRRDQLALALQTTEGRSISTGWIDVDDCSVEVGQDCYEVSAHVVEPGFFGRPT